MLIYTIHIMAKARKSIGTKFKQEEQYTPRNSRETFLIDALSKTHDKKQMAALIRDLMSLSEIAEFANRLQMAKLILEGKSYAKIAQDIGVSTSTVTRVAHWLFSGCGGYQNVLKKK